MRFRRAFGGAQYQAHRWIFAGFHPMFAGIIQVEVHLAGVGIAELADFEIDHHQTFQAAMEKQQVDAKPGIVEPQAALATDKGKVVAQFQQKIGQMLDQCFLEIGFRILVF